MKRSKKDKSFRLSFREAMAYTRRGYAIWWKAAPQLFGAVLTRQATAALTPYVPLYFTARLVNAIAGGAGARSIWRTFALLLAATAAAALLQALAARWEDAVCGGLLHSAWNRVLFDKLLAMDFQDVDDPKTRALLTQIRQADNWSSWGLRRFYWTSLGLVAGFFRVVGAAALSVGLFTLPVPQESPLAFLNAPACLVGMLLALAAAALLSPALQGRAQSYWSRFDGSAGNRFFSYFSFIALRERHRAGDIRIYGQDAYFHAYSSSPSSNAWGPHSPIARACWGSMGLFVAASTAVSRSFTGLVYLFAGLKALGGAFGVGSVAQYVGALAGLSQGISDILSSITDLRVNAEYLLPVYRLLDTPNRMYQGSLTTEKRSDRSYDIEFRDVSFRYPGADTWALRHVSIKFNIGRRLAVVGENGSGKTTFIKLLCRLYDPTEGEILLNGIDIRKYRYDDYLALFSVVFQDFKLLAQPLGQNVAAALSYDRSRAEQCLRRAGFGPRLDELPKGLDTCLYRDFEDDGVEVSGGEAQKIALARVLYHDAPFIVLDEPTAALDPEAEAEIYAKFNDIIEDKTAVYISHRLSSCRFCDEIAVFDHGQVVQQGGHEALLADAAGKYRTLWDAQAQYYTKR